MKTIAEVWPVFQDKMRIAFRTHQEVCRMSDTIKDMIDAFVDDPDGFIELLETLPCEEIDFVFPFFEDIADLPDSRHWLEGIRDATSGRASETSMHAINILL